MADKSITPSAFGHFYGANFSVLVGEEIYARLRALLPQAVSVFIWRADGVIAQPDEAAPDGSLDRSAALPLTGMAIGLEAIIVAKDRQDEAKKLAAYCEKQGMFKIPAVHLMPSWPSAWRQNVSQFIANIVVAKTVAQHTQLGTAQQQLVHLRGHYERLWLSFEKARRMIRGIGYGTRSIAFSLPPGSSSIGPGAVEPANQFHQFLPTDLAGFAGIKIFVSRAADTKASGELALSIRRNADNALIGEQRLPFSEIEEGWLSFSFDEVVPLTHGDGKLEIIWSGTGGPLLAFADSQADRFGDGAGRSLALEIIKGLADPTLDTVRFQAGSMPLERATFPGDGLLEIGRFFAGKEAEREADATTGDRTLQTDANGGWLQTHALADGISGLRLPDILHRRTKEIRASVETAHQAGSICVYMLVALRKDMPAEVLEKLLKGLGNAVDLPLVGCDRSAGLYWSSTIVEPLKNVVLGLELEEALEERLDLILAVRSLNGRADYGHCRWRWLEVGQEVDRGVNLRPLDAKMLREGSRNSGEIRAHRLPELAGQLGFYRGRAELARLSEKLGYSPFLVSEETGALQTHPYEGQMCAAILDSGLPVGTRRLSCEVGTAHTSAPDFIYMLATLPHTVKNKVAMIEATAARVSAGEPSGTDKKNGIQWNSITLKALEVRTLALELEDIPDQVADVVFAAIPTGENVSYGWCRWYSFEAALVGFDIAGHLLERAKKDSSRAK